MACYLNQFRPLAETPDGRQAIKQYLLPPFIDASCRREPDLHATFPSITALCRGEHFAPLLKVGDLVSYLTKPIEYPSGTPETRRLVAVLRVHKSWHTMDGQVGTAAHEEAATWYEQQGLPAPSNCMRRQSKPLPLDFTDRFNSDLREWDLHYRRVARTHGVFHACEAIFRDVNDPPRLNNQQLHSWFGCIPNPREPHPLAPDAFAQMLHWLAAKVSDPDARRRLEDLTQLMLRGEL